MASKQRTSGEILLGLFRLCHPLPVFFHLVAVTLFALLASWPHPSWSTLLLVVAAHTAMQSAIAALNDYCDRSLDAISGRDKPIPLGWIHPNEALLLGVLLITLMIVLLLPLNPLALLFSLLYLSLGMAYNVGLKSTPWSGIVFALAIPLIPVYAFVGVGRFVPFLFCVVPVAALLGTALNLANSLPDLEEDEASSARTLAVFLGLRTALFLCSLLLFLAVVLVALLSFTGLVAAQLMIIAGTLVLSLVLIGVLLLRFRSWLLSANRKRYFYLVVATCLILAVGWLLAVFI